MSGSKANRKLIVVSTADDGDLVGIFPDPDDPFRIDKDLHAVYVFKHDELHIASFGPKSLYIHL